PFTGPRRTTWISRNRAARGSVCSGLFCAFYVVTIVNGNLCKPSRRFAIDWQGQDDGRQSLMIAKQHVDEAVQSVGQPSFPESCFGKWLIVNQVFKVRDTEFGSQCERAEWRDGTHVPCADVGGGAIIEFGERRGSAVR
ncbi:MAG: hypothetical protein KDA55_08100, partial [Planctomycetales bacterium]|nr:hypothetical protein [Planctomycetales bacterium]